MKSDIKSVQDQEISDGEDGNNFEISFSRLTKVSHGERRRIVKIKCHDKN